MTYAGLYRCSGCSVLFSDLAEWRHATSRDGGKARELVVTLHPEFLTLRLLGTRREEIVHLEGAYFGAIKARVFREKMLKGKARAERAAISKTLRKR